jgi:hypothetical protein
MLQAGKVAGSITNYVFECLIYIIFQPLHGPGVDSDYNRNE